jgi:hypothetical protein
VEEIYNNGEKNKRRGFILSFAHFTAGNVPFGRDALGILD